MLALNLRTRLFRGWKTCSRYPDNNCRHGNKHIHTSPVRSDYYQTLGVERNVSDKELKTAYFALAKTCHPDVSSDEASVKQFQDISAAYEVLSNTKTRKEYDVSLSEMAPKYEFKSDMFKEQTPENVFRAAFGANFDDLLNSRFGYTTAMSNHRQYRMGISMKEAALGAEKYFEINAMFICSACQGTTATSRENIKGKLECQRCLGGGLIYNPQPKIPIGNFQPPEWVDCIDCAGKGYRNPQFCTVCKGLGRRTEISWHPITIPPGIQDGQQLEIEGAEPGSMYTMTITIFPDYLTNFTFNTEGEVTSEISIFYSTAVLGDTVYVPTLFGEDQLVIPPGTKDGTVLEMSLDPKHNFTVRIAVPLHKKQTSWGYRLYRDLQNEQQHVENVCRVVSMTSPSNKTMRRREVFRLTIHPLYLWAVSLADGLYHRLNKIPWFNKKFQIFDKQDSIQGVSEPTGMQHQ